MRNLLSRSRLLLLAICSLSLAVTPVPAQTGDGLGEPKLKSRDLKTLQRMLQDWFSPEVEIGQLETEMANTDSDAKKRNYRKKIRRSRKKAREARVKFLERLRDRGEKVGGALNSLPDLLEIFDGCFPYPKPFSSGKVTREYSNPDEKTYPFWMRRPKGYKPDQNWPLVFSLPDGPDVDGEEYLEKLWPGESDFSETTLFVVPEMPKDVDLSTAVDPRTQRDVDAEAKRLPWFLRTLGGLYNGYRLHTDRIYLEATGNSTPFAMRIISLWPDRFGGLILRDPKNVGNLAAQNCHLVPIFVIGKEGDENVAELKKRLEAAKHPNFTVFEQKKDAEGDPTANAREKLIPWLQGAARNLFAKDVQIVPAHDRFRSAYWVQIEGGSYLNQVAWDERPMVRASADREKNRIDIEARSVTSIGLYLNDALVDLDKEITLVINGKILKSKRSRSERLLAKGVRTRNDPRFLFVTLGIFDVPKPEGSATDGEEKGTNGKAGEK